MTGSPEAKRLLKRFDQAVTRRRPYETTWQEIYDYCHPSRTGFYSQSEGQRRNREIFDDTATVGSLEFSNRLHTGLTPTGIEWMGMEPGAEVTDPEERRQVLANLETVTKLVFQRIEASNFSTAINEAYQDFVVGYTVMAVDDGPDGLNFQTIPQAEAWIEEGPYGAVDRIWRQRPKVRAADLKVLWPDAELPPEIERQVQQDAEKGTDTEYAVIETVWRDHSARDAETWEYRALLKDKQHILASRKFTGDGACPMIAARWMKAAGEIYGRGPGWNALPSIKTANLVVQMVLENAEMAIAGMWQADDDGVLAIDNIQLVPGTIVPKAVTSAGLQPLSPGGNFDISEIVLEQQRHAIRKHLYNETLGPREGTPPTATEIHERMMELARVLGPVLDRIFVELIAPIFKRAIFLLKRRGEVMLPRIDGRAVKLRYKSPLAAAQSSDEVLRTQRYLETSVALFGPQQTFAVVDASATLRFLGEGYRVPADLIRTPAQERRLGEQVGQAAGAAMEAGMDPAALAKMAGG